MLKIQQEYTIQTELMSNLSSLAQELSHKELTNFPLKMFFTFIISEAFFD